MTRLTLNGKTVAEFGDRRDANMVKTLIEHHRPEYYARIEDGPDAVDLKDTDEGDTERTVWTVFVGKTGRNIKTLPCSAFVAEGYRKIINENANYVCAESAICQRDAYDMALARMEQILATRRFVVTMQLDGTIVDTKTISGKETEGSEDRWVHFNSKGQVESASQESFKDAAGRASAFLIEQIYKNSELPLNATE